MMVPKNMDLWDKVCEDYSQNASQLENYLDSLSLEIQTLLKSNGINSTLKSRIKNRDSYFEKLKRSYSDNPNFEIPLSDLLGIRIIVPFLEDVNNSSALLHDHYQVLEKEVKSDRLSFREFSYDSTHLLIQCPNEDLNYIFGNQKVIEIQIRTTLQDAWAEVEHELIYKSFVQYPSDQVRRKMASLNASLTLSDIIFQEIRDYQNNLIANQDARVQLMNQKLSDINDDEIKEAYSKSQGIEGTALSKIDSLIHEAISHHSAGNFNQAITFYTRAIAENPAQKVLAVLYNHRGMAYFMESDYNKAYDDFSFSISHNSNNYKSYQYRGIINKVLKHFKDAKKDFKASLELNHNQPTVWMHLGRMYFDENELTKALEAADTALKINPDLEKAKSLRKKISSRLMNGL